MRERVPRAVVPGRVPRAAMPQVPTASWPEWLASVEAAGVPVWKETVAAESLTPTQVELCGAKVAALVAGGEAAEASMAKPVLVSLDGWVIDGHHHWAAAKELDVTVPVVVIGVVIEEALELAWAWTAEAA
jgi:hypothetical protein